MATPFTRLSIVSGQQQLDVSLPSNRPISELLVDVLEQLSTPPGSPPTYWALSTPRHGAIAPSRSLDDVGILDGDVLYLSTAPEAAEPPMIDNVLDAIAEAVDADTKPWRDSYRNTVTTILLAGVTMAITVTLASLAVRPLAGVLLVVLFTASAAGTHFLRAEGGGVLGWSSLVAAPLSVFLLMDEAGLDVRGTAAAAGGLFGIAVVGYVVHRSRDLVVAGTTAGLLSLGAAGLMAIGVNGTALAAWGSPLLVLAVGILPQMALLTSGLVGLARRSETGESLKRGQVRQALLVGRSTVDGLLAAVALGAAAASATLVLAGTPAQAAVGELLAVIFLLRSRSFSQAPQVAVMLAVPVICSIATAWALPGWLVTADSTARSAGSVACLLLVIAIIAATGYVRLPEVPAAHVTNVLDRLDTIAVWVLVPLVLFAQAVYGWVASR